MLNLECSGLLYIFKPITVMKGIQNVKMQIQLNLLYSALNITDGCCLWITWKALWELFRLMVFTVSLSCFRQSL